jgi:hypothetical protein
MRIAVCCNFRSKLWLGGIFDSTLDRIEGSTRGYRIRGLRNAVPRCPCPALKNRHSTYATAEFAVDNPSDVPYTLRFE